MDVKASRSVMSFDIKDKKTHRFILVQLLVILSFTSYTATLLHLPRMKEKLVLPLPCVEIMTPSALITQGNDTFSFPSVLTTSETQRHGYSAALLCGDVWLALSLMAGTDAFWVVATFNHTLMKNWHYFVSLRMMALASIISFCLYIPSSWGTKNSRLQDYSLALCLSSLAYFLFNYALSKVHRRPPSTLINAHFGTIQQYSDKMSRFSFGWSRALQVSAIICSFPIVLTAIMPSGWVTVIPLLTIPFEVCRTITNDMEFKMLTSLCIVNSTRLKKVGKKSRVHTQRWSLHPRSLLHTLGSFTSSFKPTTGSLTISVSRACSCRTPNPGLASTIFIAQIPRVSLGAERGSYLYRKPFGYLCRFSNIREVWVPCGQLLQVVHHTCILLG